MLNDKLLVLSLKMHNTMGDCDTMNNVFIVVGVSKKNNMNKCTYLDITVTMDTCGVLITNICKRS